MQMGGFESRLSKRFKLELSSCLHNRPRLPRAELSCRTPKSFAISAASFLSSRRTATMYQPTAAVHSFLPGSRCMALLGALLNMAALLMVTISSAYTSWLTITLNGRTTSSSLLRITSGLSQTSLNGCEFTYDQDECTPCEMPRSARASTAIHCTVTGKHRWCGITTVRLLPCSVPLQA